MRAEEQRECRRKGEVEPHPSAVSAEEQRECGRKGYVEPNSSAVLAKEQRECGRKGGQIFGANNSLKRIKDRSDLSESPTKHTRRTKEDRDSTEASSLERWK